MKNHSGLVGLDELKYKLKLAWEQAPRLHSQRQWEMHSRYIHKLECELKEAGGSND